MGLPVGHINSWSLLNLENQANRPKYTAIKNRESEHQIEVVGRELRKMMPFVNDARQKEVVGSAKN